MRGMNCVGSGIALLLGAALAAPVAAVEVTRQDFQGAGGMCKAATSQFAQALRVRPLGMTNESASSVFITCNWQGDDTQNGNRGARRVFVVVSNAGDAAATVTCTLVNGFQSAFNTVASYTPKSANVAPGASATLSWVPADIAGAPVQISLPSMSCNMPGATTLQYTGKEYLEDVGA